MFHHNPKFMVKTGVKIPEGYYHTYQGIPNDAIQLGIKKSPLEVSLKNTHFLQFITRQGPDTYEFTHNQRVIWESADTDYMPDLLTPRWRVDSASCPNPYYEGGGSHKEESSWLYMYDQPGLVSDQERVIGCTFLISDNRVFKEVRWSRQYETEETETEGLKMVLRYRVDVHSADKLPDWALRTLKNQYNTNQGIFEAPRVYDIPPELDREVTQDLEEALIEARQSVLPPPEKWISLQDHRYVELFKGTKVTFKYEVGTGSHADKEEGPKIITPGTGF